MTGKPLFLLHYHVDEKLGALNRLGKQNLSKIILRYAWLPQVFFLPSPYLPYSNRYWVSYRKFWIQHQVTYQL